MNKITFSEGQRKTIFVKLINADVTFEDVTEVFVEDCFFHILYQYGKKHSVILTDSIILFSIKQP
jgi:hypothetical protein